MMSAPADDNVLRLEENCLVVLCGPTCSGKSHFARRWFRDTEIVSMEKIQAMLFDRDAVEGESEEVQSLLLSVVEHRLQANRLTVVDARCLNASLRRHLVHAARHFQLPSVLLVMDEPLERCQSRLPDPNEVAVFQLRSQHQQTQLVARLAPQEGFSRVVRFSQFGATGPMPLREALPVRSDETGPFDIIGDVHGCYDELCEMLNELGYLPSTRHPYRQHPDGRKALFLGDLVDRGPQSMAVVELVASMLEAGQAIYVPGNHCDKFARYLRGNNVMIGHGLETTVGELELLDSTRREQISQRFLAMYEDASPYLILDQGRLVVAHAGLPESFHGRLSQRIRAFALYGEVTGEIDAQGRPVRRDWAQEYRGDPLVVYGHTPVLYPRFVNNSINLDQGCVFGGALSALRYPERELVTVPAKYIYWRPAS